MTDPRISTFFYGSYISFDVLTKAGINVRNYSIGRLNGYTLAIAPLANIVHSKHGTVYGILTKLTHAELEKLYNSGTRNKSSVKYLPEAVIIHQLDNTIQAAFTYIAYNMPNMLADPAYVDKILEAAKKYGFPAWYLDHIAAFKLK